MRVTRSFLGPFSGSCLTRTGQCRSEPKGHRMKSKELNEALRLINKVFANPRLGPDQVERLRKAKRNWKRLRGRARLMRNAFISLWNSKRSSCKNSSRTLQSTDQSDFLFMEQDYARAFRIVRAAFGLRQTDLAERMQILASQLSLVEAGKRRPSLRTVEALARAVDVPPALVALLASERRTWGSRLAE